MTKNLRVSIDEMLTKILRAWADLCSDLAQWVAGGFYSIPDAEDAHCSDDNYYAPAVGDVDSILNRVSGDVHNDIRA